MLSSSSSLILTFLSLCIAVILSLPLGTNYELSARRHILPFYSDRVNQEKQANQLDNRIRLSPERMIAAEMHKNQESIKDDNDNVDDIGTKDDGELINQLDDLQLAILAEIVRGQPNRYDPVLPVDEYQIIKLPHSSVRQPVLPYTAERGNNENDLIFVDDQSKIAPSILELPEDELYENNKQTEEASKYILIPAEEMVTLPTDMLEKNLASIDKDALNDLELRSRIAILANALNERATRGL
ncbi:Retinoblastoma-related protein [Dirofilaria immitis]